MNPLFVRLAILLVAGAAIGASRLFEKKAKAKPSNEKKGAQLPDPEKLKAKRPKAPPKVEETETETEGETPEETGEENPAEDLAPEAEEPAPKKGLIS